MYQNEWYYVYFMLDRIIDIPEVDVYICESKYNERDHQIRKLKGLKVVPSFIINFEIFSILNKRIT